MPQTDTTTYFLLDSHQGLDAADGWRIRRLQNLQITPPGLGLAPLTGPPAPLNDAAGTFGGLKNPSGVAVDAEGAIYVSDRGKHGIFKIVRREGFQPYACFFSNQEAFTGDYFVYVPTANRLERWPEALRRIPQSFSEVEVLCETVWNKDQARKLILALLQAQKPESGASVCCHEKEAASIKKNNIVAIEIEKEWEGDYPATFPAGEICKTSLESLPCLGGPGSEPRRFNEPRGLAISPTGNLYVADSRNHRIQVFALRGLTLKALWGKRAGATEVFTPPATDCLSPREQAVYLGQPIAGTAPGEFNEPWEVIVDGKGNVYIADKGNHRVQKYDCCARQFSIIDGAIFSAHFFRVLYGPQVGERFVFIPARQRLEQWSSALGRDPANRSEINGLSENVLTVGAARQLVLEAINAIGAKDILGEWDAAYPPELETAPAFKSPTHLAIDLNGLLYVIDQENDQVKFLNEAGHLLGQARFASEVAGVFAPAAVAIASEGHLLLPNNAGIHRFPHFEKHGVYISRAMDSDIDRCQWHKILLDGAAEIPTGASVTVWTYTSEIERTSEDISALDDKSWHTGQTNAKNFLILSPPGRYLWLKIEIKGNGVDTPVLRRLKVFFPRLSYLQYLPAVYQAEPASKDFLERFLSIFEEVFSSIEGKIKRLPQLFDPDGVPENLLSWLASWVDMAFDPSWSVATRRQLLRNAPELYRRRGTPAGLKKFLWLALGVEVQILEHFQLRRWQFLAGRSTLGNHSQLWGNSMVKRLQLAENSRIGDFALIGTGDPLRDPFHVYAHKFSVFVPAAHNRSELTERMLKHLIDADKPAHTKYTIYKVEARFRVGVQATIGFDTMVGAYPVLVLNHCATLGFDTLLSRAPEEKGPATLKVGERSRVGVTTAVG